MTNALRFAQHGTTTRVRATTGAAKGCTGTAAALHWSDPVAVVSKQLWPTKTAENLSAYAGCGLRTARYWMRGGSISLPYFLKILRGDHGDAFLEAYMDPSDAKWWRRQKRIQAIADLKRAQAQHEKSLRAIDDLFAADD